MARLGIQRSHSTALLLSIARPFSTALPLATAPSLSMALSLSTALSFSMALSLAVTLGCSADPAIEGGDPASGPGQIGKADIFQRIDPKGSLGFGPERSVEGSFVEDGEQHGYIINVLEGSEVALAAHAGRVWPAGVPAGVIIDEAALEPEVTLNLSIYGPGSRYAGFGTDQIAHSDDYYLADPVIDWPVAKSGAYLVVVQTPLNNGRGSYTLELDCESDDCQPDAPPAGSCPEQIAQSVRDYADETISESDECYAPEDDLDAVFDDVVGDTYFDYCDSVGATYPAWCLADWDAFEAAYVEACRAELDLEYPELESGFLLAADPSAETTLSDMFDEVNDQFTEWRVSIGHIGGIGDVTLERAMATAREGFDEWCYLEETVGVTGIDAILDNADLPDVLPTIFAAAGSTDYEAGSLYNEIYYDTHQTTYVLLFPTTRYYAELTHIVGEP